MKYKNVYSSCHNTVIASSHQFVLRNRKIATILGHNTASPERGSDRKALKQIRRAENFLGCLHKKVINMDNYSTRSYTFVSPARTEWVWRQRVHKFFENPEPTSELQASERYHEANSILKTQKY
jgi:hypothetical protein